MSSTNCGNRFDFDLGGGGYWVELEAYLGMITAAAAAKDCHGDDEDVFLNHDMCDDPDDLSAYADPAGDSDPVRWVSGPGWPTIYRFYWFRFSYQGRTAEICAEDKSWEVARRRVAEAYRLREEDIETL
jgi:hypothetical protein